MPPSASRFQAACDARYRRMVEGRDLQESTTETIVGARSSLRSIVETMLFLLKINPIVRSRRITFGRVQVTRLSDSLNMNDLLTPT